MVLYAFYDFNNVHCIFMVFGDLATETNFIQTNSISIVNRSENTLAMIDWNHAAIGYQFHGNMFMLPKDVLCAYNGENISSEQRVLLLWEIGEESLLSVSSLLIATK